MSSKTPTETVRDLAQWRDDITALLSEIRTDLMTFAEEARAGEAQGVKDAQKLLSDLKFWMKAAYETEKQIADIKRHEDGLAGAHGCNLDVARIEIGCRLARIRRCCDAGKLPG